jgi:hypothetical protein
LPTCRKMAYDAFAVGVKPKPLSPVTLELYESARPSKPSHVLLSGVIAFLVMGLPVHPVNPAHARVELNKNSTPDTSSRTPMRSAVPAGPGAVTRQSQLQGTHPGDG